MKKTLIQIKKEFSQFEISKNYQIVKYINTNNVFIKCKKYNCTRKTTWNSLKNNNKPNIKSIINKKKYFDQVFIELGLHNYTFIKYNKSKIILKCKENELYEMSFSSLCNGSLPSIKSALNPNSLLKKQFKKIHGDTYRYDKINYVGNNKTITIVCKKHGEFEQAVVLHKRGQGCKKCAHEKISKLRTLSQSDVILKFKEIHGNTYDYSKVNYQYDNGKVTIVCKKHGDFSQSPSNHKRGQGCKKCAHEKISKLKKLTQSQVFEQFQKIHNNLYDYSKVDYIGSHKEITIICKKHGEFKQKVYNHYLGKGCRKCGYDKISEYRKITQSQVIKKFNDVHGNVFDYSKVDYKSYSENVIIICKKHGEFKQSPCTHLSRKKGYGCRFCAFEKTGYKNWKKHASVHCEKDNKEVKFYVILSFNNEEKFIKVGKTIRNIEERFTNNNFPYKYKILCEVSSLDWLAIHNIEKYVLRRIKELKYKYVPFQNFGGKNECCTSSLHTKLVSLCEKLNDIYKTQYNISESKIQQLITQIIY